MLAGEGDGESAKAEARDIPVKPFNLICENTIWHPGASEMRKISVNAPTHVPLSKSDYYKFQKDVPGVGGRT